MPSFPFVVSSSCNPSCNEKIKQTFNRIFCHYRRRRRQPSFETDQCNSCDRKIRFSRSEGRNCFSSNNDKANRVRRSLSAHASPFVSFRHQLNVNWVKRTKRCERTANDESRKGPKRMCKRWWTSQNFLWSRWVYVLRSREKEKEIKRFFRFFSSIFFLSSNIL